MNSNKCTIISLLQLRIRKLSAIDIYLNVDKCNIYHNLQLQINKPLSRNLKNWFQASTASTMHILAIKGLGCSFNFLWLNIVLATTIKPVIESSVIAANTPLMIN